MVEKRELMVAALSASDSQPGQFTLVLEDVISRSRLPITIGAAEAQAIAGVMARMQPSRPLTHDLFYLAVVLLEAKLLEAVIYNLQDGVFYAKLVFQKPDGTPMTLDARPSDAVAMAVRADAPIYAYETVIDQAGMLADLSLLRNKKGSMAAYTLEELEELLQRVIEKEDYESAKRIHE